MGGVPIDLRKIKTPTYILSTREDHIAPWKATFQATKIYSGPIKFVLSASGHIAGVVNPPSKINIITGQMIMELMFLIKELQLINGLQMQRNLKDHGG